MAKYVWFFQLILKAERRTLRPSFSKRISTTQWA